MWSDTEKWTQKVVLYKVVDETEVLDLEELHGKRYDC